MERLLEAGRPYAVAEPRVRTDPRGWLAAEIAGRARRQPRGGAKDRRRHVVTLGLNEGFLQLGYERDGKLHDSRMVTRPADEHVAVLDAFLAKHLARLDGETAKPVRARPLRPNARERDAGAGGTRRGETRGRSSKTSGNREGRARRDVGPR